MKYFIKVFFLLAFIDPIGINTATARTKVVAMSIDFNRKRIKITREEQTHIGVNEEIKEQIKEHALSGETQAETISRTLDNANLLYQLSVNLIEAFEETSANVSEIVLALPEKLQELVNAIRGEKKNQD